VKGKSKNITLLGTEYVKAETPGSRLATKSQHGSKSKV